MSQANNSENVSNIHRQNYIDNLKNEIIEEAEGNGIDFHTAATRVLLSWLGYEDKDLNFIDTKDSGIDAWKVSNGGIELFQIKTYDLDSDGLICTAPFDNQGVNDLSRAKKLLCFYNTSDTVSKKVKELIGHWSYILNQKKAQEDETSALVTLNLVILGDKLTTPAEEEFNRFKESITNPEKINGVDVQFDAVGYTIDSIITKHWQEDNYEWKDMCGNKKNSITLTPIKEGGWISDNKNSIFYCLSIDLVNAYRALGYQIFEPNVRAEIKRSRVNDAIKDSVRHSRRRKDFRFLNNGITITCDSFDTPKKGRNHFVVHHPGVVNGLQTMVALENSYSQLPLKDKEDFENNCSVLVRLLLKSAVDDISTVVRSTNTQNPMKARNLVSNSTEQIGFARIFASELGWFYAAKEGAWNAFDKDPRRWRPSLNKTSKEFKTTKGKNRIIDNLELAQNWLSFIGCSSTAAEERDQLFDNHYELIFKKRTKKHGYYFDYSAGSANSDNISESKAPNASLMLVSYLCHYFETAMVPSVKELRKDTQNRLGKEAMKKLGVDDTIHINHHELDGILFANDNRFALNQVLRYMPFLFTDFVGFVLYESLGQNIHNFGKEIIANQSFDILRRELDFESVRQKINDKKIANDDVLSILWLLFLDIIEDWMNGEWKQTYRNADRKQRFVLSRETRKRLYKTVIEYDEYMKRKTLTKFWAIGAKENQGLFDFIKECILNKKGNQ